MQVLMIVAFPLSALYLLFMLITMVAIYWRQPPASEVVDRDIDEEAYQKERDATRQRLNKENLEFEKRRRQRLRRLTLGLVPEKVIDCFM